MLSDRHIEVRGADARHISDMKADAWDVGPAAQGVRLEPCDPAEMCVHAAEAPQEAPAPAKARRPRRRSGGFIALMWAGVIAVAAVQHAGEVERRMATREPTAAELAMEGRPIRQIRSAWREIGSVAAAELAQDRPITPAVVEVERQVPNEAVSGQSAARTASAMAHEEDVESRSDPERTLNTQDRQKPTAPQPVEATGKSVADTKHEAIPRETAEAPKSSPPVLARAQLASFTDARTPAREAMEVDHGSIATQDEEPAPRAGPHAHKRLKRRDSTRVEVRNVYVTPGVFVLSQIYTVYGVNGRAP